METSAPARPRPTAGTFKRLLKPSLHFALLLVLEFGRIALAGSPSAPGLSLRLAGGVPSLTLTGVAGETLSVQFVGSLAPTNVWLVLTNITLSSTQAVTVDATTPSPFQRFYRVALVPTLTNAVQTSLVWVQPGTYVMGSPKTEAGRHNDETQHTVVLTQGLYMSPAPVTQGQYLDVMGSNPSYFNGVRGSLNYGTDLNRPVEQVNWYNAVEYCATLTQQQQQSGMIPTNWLYRLPTESEWEYACRANSTNEFSYGSDPTYTNLLNYAWYDVNSSNMTQEVALLLPNTWSLYDMEGDVYEWCQDWYGSYPAGPVTNPQGPSSGGDEPEKVFRGGSWDSSATECRCAGRYYTGPTEAYSFLGFRVVLAPAQ